MHIICLGLALLVPGWLKGWWGRAKRLEFSFITYFEVDSVYFRSDTQAKSWLQYYIAHHYLGGIVYFERDIDIQLVWLRGNIGYVEILGA